jgi:hypothetical protein
MTRFGEFSPIGELANLANFRENWIAAEFGLFENYKVSSNLSGYSFHVKSYA